MYDVYYVFCDKSMGFCEECNDQQKRINHIKIILKWSMQLFSKILDLGYSKYSFVEINNQEIV